MSYGTYCTLDQTKWVRGNYSSSNKLTGTIYSDRSKSTAFNLTGYTLTIRIYKRWYNHDYFGKEASIVVAASGTWSYAVAQYEMPSTPGIYLLSVELSKSGEVMNTFPEEFEIMEMPTA